MKKNSFSSIDLNSTLFRMTVCMCCFVDQNCVFVDFETARGYAIERDEYVNDLKNGCKGGSENLYKAGLQLKAVNKRNAPPRLEQEALGKKRKKKNHLARRRQDPMSHDFRSRDNGLFEPSGQFGPYFDGGDSRPIAGSWREQQREYQNILNQGIQKAQQFRRRSSPRQHIPPQPFHSRGPNLFSQQYQNIQGQPFPPRFQNAPDSRQSAGAAPRMPRLPETPRTGAYRIYSPQNRFPAPSTCNPRPGGGPQLPEKLYGASRKRWYRQQAARKQELQDAVVQ